MLVIGLDGVTLDLVRPWAQQGYLPTLAGLMASGVWGELESTLPPVTSPAWPSFATGKNPGRHGVFDFIHPRAGTFDMVNASQIDGRMVWEYLSDAGFKVGVLNVPVTYPPRPVNGYLVPGLLSPDQGKTTYPPDFLKPYTSQLGDYRLTPRVSYKPGNEDGFIADIFDLIETQTRYALRLFEEHPVDFFMVHFLASDVAQHALWKHQDAAHPLHCPELASRYGTAIRDIYARLDASIGRLIERMPADTHVIVMSDHGFGSLHHIVNLNNLFIASGLMALRRDPWVQARAWAFKHGLTPAGLWKIIERLGWQNLVWQASKKTRNEVISKILGFEDVDWSRTLAYSMGHVGQVYLNVKGREPYGIVEPDDYLRVRERVCAVLQTLRHPSSGRPLVEQIIPREQAASGPHMERGPDLHLVMDGGRTIAFSLFASDGRVITRQIRGDSGSHRRQGILIASGPDVAQANRLIGARIIDLAPTIMYLMGVPVPDDMDGHVLPDIVSSQMRAGRAVGMQPGRPVEQPPTELSSEEQVEVEERLRALGYLS